MDHKYIECQCMCDEHVLRISTDPYDHIATVAISYYLNDWDGVWKRIWRAFKYIFKRSCRWGHFDTTIICGDRIPELITLLEEAQEKYLKEMEKKKKLEKVQGDNLFCEKCSRVLDILNEKK